jgi:hypothetical protein
MSDGKASAGSVVPENSPKESPKDSPTNSMSDGKEGRGLDDYKLGRPVASGSQTLATLRDAHISPVPDDGSFPVFPVRFATTFTSSRVRVGCRMCALPHACTSAVGCAQCCLSLWST